MLKMIIWVPSLKTRYYRKQSSNKKKVADREGCSVLAGTEKEHNILLTIRLANKCNLLIDQNQSRSLVDWLYGLVQYIVMVLVHKITIFLQSSRAAWIN